MAKLIHVSADDVDLGTRKWEELLEQDSELVDLRERISEDEAEAEAESRRRDAEWASRVGEREE